MLTDRQFEVAQRVAEGKSAKRIARELDVSVGTVRAHIRDAAERIPGDGRPRWKLLVFVLSGDEEEAA